jgi:predicted ATPase
MKTEQTNRQFSWLHISDLYISNSDFIGDEQWSALHDDLCVLHDESGPWDAVFVTGDITRSAAGEEYETATRLLNEHFLEPLRVLGSNPILLVVPGNHDVEWKFSNRPEARLLRFWSQETELRRELTEKDSPYRDVIDEAFNNYRTWIRLANIPRPKTVNHGILPGDFSSSLTVNDLKIGVVGLNTAFTQISRSRGIQQGAMYRRQLTSVCGPTPETWASEHDFNFLITHHPPTELDAYSVRVLRADIAVPRRFDIHLCGSLHNQKDLVRTQESAALLIQAPPLRVTERIRGGYIVGTVGAGLAADHINLRCRGYDSVKGIYGPDPRLDPRIPEEFFLRERSRSSRQVRRQPSKDLPFRVEQLELLNFRSFERLTISFDRNSSLGGNWTCLAGINGAGKSSILQSLALILLGEPLIRELGGDRISRMRRVVKHEQQTAEIRAWVNRKGHQLYLELKLDQNQLQDSKSNIEAAAMLQDWQSFRSDVVLGYGATRNISDYHDTRYSNLSPDVGRLMTLFDPLAQITSAEALLGQSSINRNVLVLFRKLLEQVFEKDLELNARDNDFLFNFKGDAIDALNLPDGFRSSVAWLIDLCSVWAEKFQTKSGDVSLSEVQGIVLVDEIDLHLHPSLQRIFVPRLRAALPQVQWIVTTHSPLILSSFDSAEIVALDRDEPGGIRFLDRQILGFSTDQIYNWLMETSPTSAVMEQKLDSEANEFRPELKSEIAELLEVSPEVDPEEAKQRIRVRQDRLRKLNSSKL